MVPCVYSMSASDCRHHKQPAGTLQDKPEGKLTDMWSDALTKSGLPTADVANALADLLSVKDETEITNVKKAAFMTASVMKSSTVPRLEGKLIVLQIHT